MYYVLKLYLKDEETKKEFKRLIVEYGTADKTIKQIILAYKAGRLDTEFL